MLEEISVSVWAVLLGGIASMVIGMLWYGPVLFGKKWMTLIGVTPENMEKAKASATKSYTVAFIGSLVMAYVLGYLIILARAFTVSEAVILAAVVWLGFVATTGSLDYLFAPNPKPWGLYVLNNGYQLAVMAVMAIIHAYFA